jgi:hypothetical protein
MARTERNLHLAYGFPRVAKHEGLMRTMAGRAMLALGPIRAYYSQSSSTWTLDGKPCEPWDFITEAKRLGKCIGAP